MAWREESIVSQRLEFVMLASAEGANVRELCRRFKISAPTGYKWLGRHAQGGASSLQDRSRRPHQSPERTDAGVEAAILAARVEHRRGQDWLGPELGCPHARSAECYVATTSPCCGCWIR